MSARSPRLAVVLATLPLAPRMRLLEVGCGPGVLARAMAERVKAGGAVVGINRSPRAIAQAIAAHIEDQSGALSFRIGEAESFALAPGEAPFDLIVSVRVGALDGRHPEAGARAWPRLRAALAPGGRIFGDGFETAGPA